MFGQFKRVFILCIFTITSLSCTTISAGGSAMRYVGNFSPAHRYEVFDVAIFSNSVAMICIEGGIGKNAKFDLLSGTRAERTAYVYYPHFTPEMSKNTNLKSVYVVPESSLTITNGICIIYIGENSQITLSDFVITYSN